MDNKLPNNYLSLVSDLVRQEAGGKVSALGIYANGLIIVGPNQELPINIPLGFYFAFVDGEGKYDVEARLISPSGKELLKTPLAEKHEKHADKPLTLNINITSMALPEWGDYEFTLSLDGKPYVRSFSLSRSPTPLTL